VSQSILTPDEARRLAPGADVLVAGRVLAHTSEGVQLGDAFTTLHAAWSAAPRADATLPGLGAWVVLSGTLSTEGVTDAVLVETHGGQFRADGDAMRFGRVARTLALVARAKAKVRAHFEALGFVEVTTPMRVLAPGTDVYLSPLRAERGWLITSPEFHMKRLLVGGLPKIYQFATCSRDEERGPWHQPEFTLLEWYRAFASVQDVQRDTEELVRCVCSALHGRARLERGGHTLDLSQPFERLTVREAFRRYAGVADACALATLDEARYFELFVSHVEPALARLPHPVFLTEYPTSQAALARPCPHDPSVAERFELYIAGVELCNGYGELTDADEQRRRFTADQAVRKQRGLPEIPLDEALLEALQEGMPRAAGNALGFERLISVCLGVPLADVLAFGHEPR
jgi:lysyl-tRNA synthetase class 2